MDAGGDADGGSALLEQLRGAALPDEFWMYSYKVLPCPHGYRHSWTHCPFSHAGETARRRCPRAFTYLPDPCPHARAKRQCPNGDACPYAHNTFEQWLHPARYRTRLCYLGANCKRATCFFAHSVDELRSVDEADAPSQSGPHSLPQLPMPPPLPAHGSGVLMGSPGLVDRPSPTAGGMTHMVMGPHAGGPGALMQPVAMVCMPQPQGQPRPDAYRPRPGPPPPGAALLPPPPPQGLVAMQPLHPHALQLAASPMGPMTAVYVHRGPMHPAGMAPLPTAPPAVGTPYGMAYGAAAAFYPGPLTASPLAPPAPPPLGTGGGRMRSWSTPGDASPETSMGGGLESGPYGYLPQHQQQPHHHHHQQRASDMGHAFLHHRASTGAPGRGVGAGTVPAPAPRHMPAPTNRAGAVRRVSNPASPPSTAGVEACAAAGRPASASLAAVAVAMSASSPMPQHHDGQLASPHALIGGSAAAGGAAAAAVAQQRRLSAQAEAMEAALLQLALAEGASPAPLRHASTPAAALSPVNTPTHVAAGAASPALRASMPGSAVTLGSPALSNRASMPGEGAFALVSPTAAAVYGPAAGAALDPASAAAVAAGMGIAAGDVGAADAAAAAAAVPYQVLLQHVLRSTSAAAAPAEPQRARHVSGLLGVDEAGAEDDDGDADDDDGDAHERTSDPGPRSLRAAIRRMSSEMGFTAAAARHSDPGQPGLAGAGGGGPASDAALLLPLLQTLLNEGLATGQFELVNGQLQMRGAAVAASAAAAASGGGSPASPSAAGAAATKLAPAGPGRTSPSYSE